VKKSSKIIRTLEWGFGMNDGLYVRMLKRAWDPPLLQRSLSMDVSDSKNGKFAAWIIFDLLEPPVPCGWFVPDSGSSGFAFYSSTCLIAASA
jgi:hypothetical protein